MRVGGSVRVGELRPCLTPQIAVEQLHVHAGQAVTIYLHGGATIHAVELHVDQLGVARVLLEDQSIAMPFAAAYGDSD